MTNKRFYIILVALITFFLIANITLIQINKENYRKLDFHEVLYVLDDEFLIHIDDVRYMIGINNETVIVDLKDKPLSSAQIKQGDYVHVKMNIYASLSDPVLVAATKIIVKDE